MGDEAMNLPRAVTSPFIAHQGVGRSSRRGRSHA